MNLWKRPTELKAYLAWDDAWRCVLMDLAASQAAGDERAFQAAAMIIYAGWLAGYDG